MARAEATHHSRRRPSRVRIAAQIWLVVALVGGALALAPSLSSAAGPSEVGQWAAPFPLPLIAIHAVVLPNNPGKVLLVSSTAGSGGSAAYLLDTATLALKNVSMTNSYDMMCGGGTMLSDG